MSSSSLAADCLKWDRYWSGNFDSTDCSRWCSRSVAYLHLNVIGFPIGKINCSESVKNSPLGKLLFMSRKSIPLFCGFLYVKNVFFYLQSDTHHNSQVLIVYTSMSTVNLSADNILWSTRIVSHHPQQKYLVQKIASSSSGVKMFLVPYGPKKCNFLFSPNINKCDQFWLQFAGKLKIAL